MTEQQRPTGDRADRMPGAAPDPDVPASEQVGPERAGADPTADFLADVRPEETPWRRDRPADPAGQDGGGEPNERRSHTFATAARRAAPYIQGAAVAGWVAASALDDQHEDGYGEGYDAGFDAGGGG